jgi:hypothetical protein
VQENFRQTGSGHIPPTARELRIFKSTSRQPRKCRI